MWKINKINIKNFKFFYKPFELDLKGKNLLLYGENGSGKSSIYWSFYTLFQSCYKKPTIDSAQKYFDPSNDENLRNRFSDEGDSSGIKVEFISTDDKRTKSFEDSDEICNTSNPTDPFMNITAGSSSFMNYKFLASIFDFKNSENAEIFKIFVSDIFPALILEPDAKLQHVDGSYSTNMTAEYWWKYIQDTLWLLPRGSNPRYVKKTSDEFIRYKDLINVFNSQISNHITLIERTANQILSKQFNTDARLILTFENAAVENIPLTPCVELDKKLITPRIIAKAKLDNNKVKRQNISHPRSFFNEAKLTCISIALRFAVINSMHRASEDGVSALFLDDILISLDMSTRLDVIDMITAYAGSFQILLFTHDYIFYDILKSKIRQENKDKDWQFKELYCIDDELSDIPDSLLLDNQNPIQLAKAHYKRRDYAAAANALRREAELQMKRLLPYNQTLAYSKIKDKTIPEDLAIMLSRLPDFYRTTGIPNVTPNIQIFRERILNPLSHDDNRTPIYKSELVKAIKELEELNEIKVSSIKHVNDCSSDRIYCLELGHNERNAKIEFYFLEEWKEFSYKEITYLSSPKIHIVNSTSEKFANGTETQLLTAYNFIKDVVYRQDAMECPNIKECYRLLE